MNNDNSHLEYTQRWWISLRDGDLTTAQKMLDEGFDIEDVNSRGETGFFFAAANGHLEQARWLLDQGADATSTDINGANPLHHIIRRRSVDEIETVTKMGVNINGQDHKGTTPLLFAVMDEYKAMEMTEVCLKMGANPNIAAKSNTTPLLAASSRHLDVMYRLLKAGANHLAVGARGSLLHAILESKDKKSDKVFEDIVKTYPDLDVNHLSRAGSTPLAFAIERGGASTVKVLLEAGADPNQRSQGKLLGHASALMILAAGRTDSSLFELAFKNGADPELRDDNGKNALFYALFSGTSEEEYKEFEAAAKKLGPKADKKALKEINDAMAIEVWHRKKRNVESLIKGGASPTAPLSKEGVSAYDLALKQDTSEKRVEAIRWLHSLGFAVNPGVATVRFPVSKEDQTPNPGFTAIRLRDENAVEALIDAGLDPAKPDDQEGYTLVHALALANFTEEENNAIFLAQRNIQVKTNHGQDEEKHKEAIDKLKAQVEERVEKLENWRAEGFERLTTICGNVDVPDKNGLTPLAFYISRGETRLAEVALKAGADPLKEDIDGDHALYVAMKTGQIEWVHRLVEHLGPSSDAVKNILLDMTYSSPEDGGSRKPFMAAIQSLSLFEDMVPQWLTAKDEAGNVPLLVAAATAQEDLVDAFLAMRADPNVRDSEGNTAMHHAVDQNRGDIVKALINWGGVDQANNAGKTALDMAVRVGNPYVARAVRETASTDDRFEMKLDEAIVEAAQKGREKGKRAETPAIASSRRFSM